MCPCVADTLKVSPYRNEQKGVVLEDGQLALDARNLNLSNVSNHGKAPEAPTFSFQELAAATGNFDPECCLGEGGFGKVYKGYVQRIDQVCYLNYLLIYYYICCWES